MAQHAMAIATQPSTEPAPMLRMHPVCLPKGQRERFIRSLRVYPCTAKKQQLETLAAEYNRRFDESVGWEEMRELNVKAWESSSILGQNASSEKKLPCRRPRHRQVVMARR